MTIFLMKNWLGYHDNVELTGANRGPLLFDVVFERPALAGAVVEAEVRALPAPSEDKSDATE